VTAPRCGELGANEQTGRMIEEGETTSKLGFNLTWWGRLLGTCRDQPRAGYIGMTIGISDCRDPPRSRVSRRHAVAIPWRDQGVRDQSSQLRQRANRRTSTDCVGFASIRCPTGFPACADRRAARHRRRAGPAAVP
jgi:hypothetical protein